jgi:hypothetical protein
VIELLGLAMLIGGASASMTVLLRYAPVISRWTLEGKKPWVCDVCMTLWTTLLISGVVFWHGEPRALLACLPSYAIGKAVLLHISGPTGMPPIPTDFGGDDDDSGD